MCRSTARMGTENEKPSSPLDSASVRHEGTGEERRVCSCRLIAVTGVNFQWSRYRADVSGGAGRSPLTRHRKRQPTCLTTTKNTQELNHYLDSIILG